MKLNKKIFLSGTIKTKTGMHIGGSNMGLAIGGADSPVLRDPITNVPYIPGSSLKGKMRSLLEKVSGNITSNGNHCNCGDCEICKVFGSSADTENKTPTRLLVRDAMMDAKSVIILDNSKNTDMPFTEVKTEVTINRITSKANPRQIERVPAGVSFSFELIINVFEDDNEYDSYQLIEQAIRLINDDYLGGSGTRGYGKVEMIIADKKYKNESNYKNGNKAQDWDESKIKKSE